MTTPNSLNRRVLPKFGFKVTPKSEGYVSKSIVWANSKSKRIPNVSETPWEKRDGAIADPAS